MKVTFAEREIELKPTDRFVLDVDGACTDPYITLEEFLEYCNSTNQDESLGEWAAKMFGKYVNQYEFEGGVYGAFIVRNNVALDDCGQAVIYNSDKEEQFSKELFEETLAA